MDRLAYRTRCETRVYSILTLTSMFGYVDGATGRRVAVTEGNNRAPAFAAIGDDVISVRNSSTIDLTLFVQRCKISNIF